MWLDVNRIILTYKALHSYGVRSVKCIRVNDIHQFGCKCKKNTRWHMDN